MASSKKNRISKRVGWTLLIVFMLMNIVAYFHAYKLTPFSNSDLIKTKTPTNLTAIDKIKTLFFGINNPRPTNNVTPSQKFETIKLQSNKIVECWNIKVDSAKGTIILFHGYGGQKSSMLDKSDEFVKLDYNTLLVDFIGSGGSEGNQTTRRLNNCKGDCWEIC